MQSDAVHTHNTLYRKQAKMINVKTLKRLTWHLVLSERQGYVKM